MAWRYFIQIFTDSDERLNSPVYSAPPCANDTDTDNINGNDNSNDDNTNINNIMCQQRLHLCLLECWSVGDQQSQSTTVCSVSSFLCRWQCISGDLCSIFRPVTVYYWAASAHRSTALLSVVYSLSSVVCRSVCYSSEPCTTVEAIEMPYGLRYWWAQGTEY